ncbi:hypothetical protein D3C85_1870170 [compost metagenome]
MSKRFQDGMLRLLAGSAYWPPVRSMRALTAAPGRPGMSQSAEALNWNSGTPTARLPSFAPLWVPLNSVSI